MEVKQSLLSGFLPSINLWGKQKTPEGIIHQILTRAINQLNQLPSDFKSKLDLVFKTITLQNTSSSSAAPEPYIDMLTNLHETASPILKTVTESLELIKNSSLKDDYTKLLEKTKKELLQIITQTKKGNENRKAILAYCHYLAKELIQYQNSMALLSSREEILDAVDFLHFPAASPEDLRNARTIKQEMNQSFLESYHKMRKLWYDFCLLDLQIKQDIKPQLTTTRKISQINAFTVELSNSVITRIKEFHEKINTVVTRSLLSEEAKDGLLELYEEAKLLDGQIKIISLQIATLQPKVTEQLQLLAANIKSPLGEKDPLDGILLTRVFRKDSSSSSKVQPENADAPPNLCQGMEELILLEGENAFIQEITELAKKIETEQTKLHDELAAAWSVLSLNMYEASSQSRIVSARANLQPQLSAIVKDQESIKMRLLVDDVGQLQREHNAINRATTGSDNNKYFPRSIQELEAQSLDQLYQKFIADYDCQLFQLELPYLKEIFEKDVLTAIGRLKSLNDQVVDEIKALYTTYLSNKKELTEALKSKESLAAYKQLTEDPELLTADDDDFAEALAQPDSYRLIESTAAGNP